MHLLYSLPDALQSFIYEFDSTYSNTFKSVDFKNELLFYQMTHIDREKFNQYVLEQIISFLDDLNYLNYTWSNDYGFFNFDFTTKKQTYLSQFNLIDFVQNNYQIAYFPDGDVVKFKILPRNLEIPNKILYYDGFICSNQKSILIADEMIDKPIHDTEPLVNPYYNTENITVWITPRDTY